MSLISVENLSKHFRSLKRREGLGGAFQDLFSRNYQTIKAVDAISFSVEQGELVGFIGPNGAGKSTTIKMLTGVLEPTSGSLSVNGLVPFRQRRRYVQDIGVVFGQRTQLWWDLAVIESFKLLKAIYRIDTKVYETNLGVFNDLVNLKELYGKPVRSLSLGQRMLCDIAAAFLHDPKIIFLDEPTIGLDVDIRAKVRHIIGELNRLKQTTVILTSHDVGDIESLAKRIVMIDKGSILYDGKTEHFNGIFGAFRTLRLDVHELSDEQIPALEQKISKAFSQSGSLEFQPVQNGWLSLTFEQDKTPLLALLPTILEGSLVRDIQVEDIAMEEVIKRVYAGALR